MNLRRSLTCQLKTINTIKQNPFNYNQNKFIFNKIKKEFQKLNDK